MLCVLLRCARCGSVDRPAVDDLATYARTPSGFYRCPFGCPPSARMVQVEGPHDNSTPDAQRRLKRALGAR